MDDAPLSDCGSCLLEPPVVCCNFDGASGEASIVYERPQTSEGDYCARFESRSGT